MLYEYRNVVAVWRNRYSIRCAWSNYNNEKDSKNQGASEASITTKVDYIARGVDDIRLDRRAQASKIESMNEKLIRVDESSKQAHKRIDKLEGISHES